MPCSDECRNASLEKTWAWRDVLAPASFRLALSVPAPTTHAPGHPRCRAGSGLAQGQARLADGKMVVAGEDQVQRLAVAAHPLRRETARLAGPDVPLFRVEGRRPRAPRLRGVVDTEAALESRVAAGQRLAPQVALQARVVADATAVALAGVREHGAAPANVLRPDGLALLVQRREELVGVALAEPVLLHPGQDH